MAGKTTNFNFAKFFLVAFLLNILGIFCVFSFRFFETKNDLGFSEKKEVKKVATEFCRRWYNYETQQSVDFLNTVKPFMTEELYEATYYIHTRRPKDFLGQTPLRSTIVSAKVTFSSKDKAQAEVVIDSLEIKTGKKYQHIERIKLVKTKGKWLVSYF